MFGALVIVGTGVLLTSVSTHDTGAAVTVAVDRAFGDVVSGALVLGYPHRTSMVRWIEACAARSFLRDSLWRLDFLDDEGIGATPARAAN